MGKNDHMPKGRITNAFTLLDCAACRIRVYVEARGTKDWDGRCLRCGHDRWYFVGVRVVKTPQDYQVLAMEATADAKMIEEELDSVVQTDADEDAHGVPR